MFTSYASLQDFFNKWKTLQNKTIFSNFWKCIIKTCNGINLNESAWSWWAIFLHHSQINSSRSFLSKIEVLLHCNLYKNNYDLHTKNIILWSYERENLSFSRCIYIQLYFIRKKQYFYIFPNLYLTKKQKLV